jgi:hypothetical protein
MRELMDVSRALGPVRVKTDSPFDIARLDTPRIRKETN